MEVDDVNFKNSPQVDAWQVCHSILSGADSPMEARLFASQTFRTKVSLNVPSSFGSSVGCP
jgi:hypothetical protein